MPIDQNLSYNELSELAVSVALRAGDFLDDRPTNFELKEKSSINDFATQMDIASERLIVSGLLAERPDDGIIGEEGAARSSQSGFTWVIDPLDGTVNYFYGLPGWNVSIAVKEVVAEKEVVVAGAVYSPTTQSLWYASRGGGAYWRFRDKTTRIFCNDPVEINRALVGTGFAYDQEVRKSQAAVVNELIPRFRDVRRMGAAATDLCSVAMGALDAYFESGLNEWDYAAGGLICEEAGARFTGLNGEPASKAMTVVAGPHLHMQLLSTLTI